MKRKRNKMYCLLLKIPGGSRGENATGFLLKRPTHTHRKTMFIFTWDENIFSKPQRI